jgi:translation initiation factor RLI1
MSRIAIVDYDKCTTTKCKQECKKSCPVNMTGKECVEIVKIENKMVSEIKEKMCKQMSFFCYSNHKSSKKVRRSSVQVFNKFFSVA